MECKKCLYLLIDGKYYPFCGMKLCQHCDEQGLHRHDGNGQASA